MFLQNFALSASGRRIHRMRYGGKFKSFLAQLVDRDLWSNDRILEYQRSRLISCVRKAAQTVPYYKRKIESLGIEPEEIRKPGDLSALPVLHKWEVQDHWADMHSPEYPVSSLRRIRTSGTTGTGMLIDMTLDSYREQWAVWWRHWLRHGLRFGRWAGIISGNVVVPIEARKPPFWRVNYPGRAVHFSNYHLSDRNMPHYIEEICKWRFAWLHGYPSALALLANAVLEVGIEMPFIKWVSTGSESLMAHQREVIEKAFGVKVIDHYGLGEMVSNISQCPAGNLHVDEDFAYTEFVPHPSMKGLVKIVGTSFANPAFPLIRFDTADLAILQNGVCECGLPGRLVKEIIGREEDYVLTPDGSRFTQPGFIFMGLMNIREAQVVQKKVGLVEIRVVRGKDYSDYEESKIVERAKNMMGERMRVQIRYVDAVERTAAGKIKCMVSEISNVSV